jgi:hypothetical protein
LYLFFLYLYKEKQSYFIGKNIKKTRQGHYGREPTLSNITLILAGEASAKRFLLGRRSRFPPPKDSDLRRKGKERKGKMVQSSKSNQ